MTYNPVLMRSLFIDDPARALVFNQLGFKVEDMDRPEFARDLIGTLDTIQHHGLAGAVNGFIYTYEINSFYADNEGDIMDALVTVAGADELMDDMRRMVGAEEILLKGDYFKQYAVWSYVEIIACGIDIDELRETVGIN